MIIGPCEIEGCGVPCLPRHHKFPQRKANRFKYESYYVREIDETLNLIDHPANKQRICSAHHAGHAGQGRGLVVWKEDEFCKVIGVELTMEYGVPIIIKPPQKHLTRVK